MIADEIREQIDAIGIERGRPLLISDADEVLFAFMAGLESYLQGEGLSFDFSSFAITGNVKDADGMALDREAVRSHLGVFFERHTEALDPVEHAAETLAELSKEAQIIVLSNIPLAQRGARARALARHGMDYPLIANEGAKGPAVRLLHDRAAAPAVFIDDIPHNHASVRDHAEDVHRLHFVADTRLARLIPQAEHCHARADTWLEARPIIERHLFGG
ncbi:MAG: hypothetical protein ACMVY4_08920 [Minwuia sp.]|uniref:hypothetical protein n=1 Tax=Minwuia sp. TaxID=2493630 RepID=UPI003A88483F